MENNRYVPYLVLTDDYNGNTLLLRKYILPETRRINEYYSYYENSEIDNYLNGEYWNEFSEIKDLIIDSEIEIIADSAIGYSNRNTTAIARKFFLLSLCELALDMEFEGSPLAYFKDKNNKIAYMEDNIASSWWLRSPEPSWLSLTYAVGSENTLGFTNSSDKNGIRPAFCLSSDLKVKLVSDILPNQSCYILDLESN
jgi:hypothetical protein